MATAKKAGAKAAAKKTAKKTAAKKAPAKKTAATKSSAAKKPVAAKKSATAKKATSAKKSSATKSAAAKKGSSATAHKTGSKTRNGGQAWTDKRSSNPSSTGHGKAKKIPAKQSSQCWPGFEPVPGKKPGTKGSCKPKPHQTAAEKKSDAMEAAASKLRKGK